MRIVIDGETFELPADTDPDGLRRRVAQAVFRGEVEQLYLADGHTMLVNWRTVRFVQIRTGPAVPDHSGIDTAPAATGDPPAP
ncbi:hypothetical protein BCD49_01515 [Pseudofrankia sp. EUN1h]|nr:hypothetical protein BCD49_01515 [Pseudofrankia sp. EUN1h]